MVTKDTLAVQKREAYLNIQPSNMASEIMDDNHLLRIQQLEKEKEFMNWRKTGSVNGSQRGSIVNRRLSKQSNVSKTSIGSFNNALQKATQMMERNRKRASFASNNSMGMSDGGGLKSSGLPMRQSIASVGSDQQMNTIQQPGLVISDQLQFGSQFNQQQ